MGFNLKSEMELLLRVAEEHFCEDGFCSTAVVAYKNGQMHVVTDKIANDREVVERKALKLVRKIKPQAVIMIAEAWWATNDEFYRPGISLEDHPRRKEALIASGRSADESLMIVQPITRRGEEVFLEEPEYHESFAGWFDDCKLSV
jgi:hypothetical protein